MFVESVVSKWIVPMAQAESGPVLWDGHMMYMPFGGLPTLLIGIAIIAGAVFAMRALARKEGGDSAMDILKKRYARGEIDKATFEQMKKDIEE